MSKDWTPEDMDALNGVVRTLQDEKRTLAERLGLVEKAHTDLQESIKARDAAAAADAAKRSMESDGDRAVVRKYTLDANTAKGIGPRGPTHSRPVMASKSTDVALRMYGQYDQLGEWYPGLLDDKPMSEWQSKAQGLAEEVTFVRALGVRPDLSVRRFVAHMQKGPEEVKRVFTDASDYGSELLPDSTTPLLQMAAEMPRNLENMIPSRMVGPGGAKENPFLNYGSVQFFKRDFAAADDNDPATFKTSDLDFDTRSLSPVTIAAVLPVDLDAEEDAIIAWLPLAREAILRARIDAVEDAIINGDTAATHQDTIASWTAGGRWPILGSSKDHRKSWIGLRARAFDTSCTTNVGTVATAKDYVKQLANLGVAHAFGSTVLMPSPMHFLTSLAVDADLWRADGAGVGASVLQGPSYQLWGRPIMLSQFNSDNLNDSGVYDNSTTNKGGRLAFDINRFEIARRRGLRMSVESYEHKGIKYMTVTDRLIFRTFDGSTTKNVHYGYNAPTS